MAETRSSHTGRTCAALALRPSARPLDEAQFRDESTSTRPASALTESQQLAAPLRPSSSPVPHIRRTTPPSNLACESRVCLQEPHCKCCVLGQPHIDPQNCVWAASSSPRCLDRPFQTESTAFSRSWRARRHTILAFAALQCTRLRAHWAGRADWLATAGLTSDRRPVAGVEDEPAECGSGARANVCDGHRPSSIDPALPSGTSVDPG